MMKTTITKITSDFDREIRENLRKKERRINRIGIILLISVVLIVIYALYSLLIQPTISRHLPEHQVVPMDTPPIELTSFQVRSGSTTYSPQSIAIEDDSLFVSISGSPEIIIYSATLELLTKLELNKPKVVIPTAITIKDTLLIVADSSLGLVVLYDRGAYYNNSVSYYPDGKVKIRPVHLFSNGKLLTVTDPVQKKISVISLFEDKPFYNFMELLTQIPSQKDTHLRFPTCSAVSPDDRIWVGSKGQAFIFSLEGTLIQELPQPKHSKITYPIDFAIVTTKQKGELSSQANATQQIRMHLLDRNAGKVFVYDLSGKLTLVYPRHRQLHHPISIAVNDKRRHIYIVESDSREITIFGY